MLLLPLDFGLGLWRLHTMPGQRLQFLLFYWLFSTHFFGLSTKFGHSIPRPHDLDGHSVRLPLLHNERSLLGCHTLYGILVIYDTLKSALVCSNSKKIGLHPQSLTVVPGPFFNSLRPSWMTIET